VANAAAGNDPDMASAALDAAQSLNSDAVASGPKTARQLAEEWQAALDRDPNENTVSPGIAALKRVLRRLDAGSMTLVGAPVNVGKALRSTEPVLTPSGWKPIGELSVGEMVVSADGTPTEVIGVYPQGVRDLFTVTFDDGATVDADASHVWSVWTDNQVSESAAAVQMTTADLLSAGLVDNRPSWSNQRGLKWRIPVVAPVEHPKADLPIAPYLLGVILGDGSLTGWSIGLSKRDDEDLKERCASLLPPGVAMRRQAGAAGERGAYRLTVDKGQTNPLLLAMRRLGLMGLGSHDKFIPDEYLLGSVEQRGDLMRGLLDTDGTVGKRGGPLQYCTTSERLMTGFVALVRSLGGVARVTTKMPSYHYRGEKKVGRLAYTATICIPNSIAPFFCSRKLQRYKPRTKMPCRKIASIVPTTRGDATCIRVAHDSNLFVTKDYVVTHNSSMALEMALQSIRDGESAGYLSMEDPERIVTERLMSILGEVSPRFVRWFKPGDACAPAIDKAARVMHALNDRLLVSNCVGMNERETLAEMSAMAKRGCKLIILDYIGVVGCSQKQQDRRNEIRWIATRFKARAARTKTALVVVSQLQRPRDGDVGRKPNKHSFREAGDLEAMAEYAIVMWRTVEDDFAPVYCELVKSKTGGVGYGWTMQRELYAPQSTNPGSSRLVEVRHEDEPCPRDDYGNAIDVRDVMPDPSPHQRWDPRKTSR
jgi:replicative DNA helicase